MFIILFVFIVLLCILLIKMTNEARRDEVSYTSLLLPQLPQSFCGTKLFFISDIHKRKISEKIIAEIQGKVDAVIIGGDLAEGGVPLSRIEENIKNLVKVAPTYFVWGNNDYETDFKELDVMLLENGVKILDNTAVTFESSTGEKIHLLGVDDKSRNRHRLDLALQDADDLNSFKILVSHDPEIEQCIKKENGIRLLLSGHTHGGQIRLLGWGLAEKGGIVQREDYLRFISNGYGTTKVPLRLGAPAETHVLILTASK
jgi:uncharacterized protein